MLFNRGILAMCAFAWSFLAINPAYPNSFSHGDACTAAGAWHQTNSSGNMHFLICDGSNWQSAVQFDAAGNNIRLDDNPGVGSQGCLRYNGTNARMEYSNDCTNWLDFASPVWTFGSNDDIYYDAGTTPRVGIGTTTPSYMLDVDGGIRSTSHIVINPTMGASTPNFFDLSDLESVVLTSPENGQALVYDGSNWVNSTSSGLWSAGSGDDIYYNSGSAQVGIGKTDPEAALDVVGDIRYTGVLIDVSDMRMKHDIRAIESSLQKLTSLNGFSFKMKGDESGAVEYGVSAQEVLAVFPELVHQLNDDGTLGVSYNGLIAPMIEAMKEQQAQINSLQAEIETLKTQIQSRPEEL